MAIRALGPRRPRCAAAAFVADSAEVSGDVELGEQVGIWYGAVLRGDIAEIRVGPRSNVQDGAILHTDEEQPCILGAAVTVGHGAILHGCRVGDGATVGMRATVLSGAVVGPGAVVGAGALVTEGQRVPAGAVALGVPARVVRAVRPEEAERFRAGVDHYVDLARLHRHAQDMD